MTILSKLLADLIISLRHPVHFLSLGFGSGLAPKAPGTFGTLAILPLLWLMGDLPLTIFIGICVFVSVVGIWLCGYSAKAMGVHDHPAIVWDEFAGMMITMIAVPMSLTNLVVGFVVFRLFDIIKPWPINIVDRKLTGGFGIMLDDIIAGVLACGVLQLLITFSILSH